MKVGETVTSQSALPEEQIRVGLAKIGLAMRQLTWQGARGRGLTPTQAQILVFLNGEPGHSAAMSAIAAALAVTLATASDSIAALEGKGLIRRRRDPNDKRVVQAVLTPEGQQCASEAATWTDLLAASIEILTPDEQAVFLRGLVKMIRSLQAAGRIPVARMCMTCTYFCPYTYDDPERPHHCAFVDAPFGDGQLRLDCPDHMQAGEEVERIAWSRFASNGR